MGEREGGEGAGVEIDQGGIEGGSGQRREMYLKGVMGKWKKGEKEEI